ncbi:ArsR/SmtB family transcription factor [Streptomyces albus]|uniref:ArsR/SmtB family transcription factor n=1 Tax=Streptomyces albus TaxID=1888 RepID=UPI000AC04462
MPELDIQTPTAPIYTELARVGKVLANPLRLRLLDLLDARERTVEQLSREFGIPLKNTSAQLQQLRSAHLVSSRKDGTRVLYRPADDEVGRFLGVFQEFARRRLADLRSAVSDGLGDLSELEPVTAEELTTRLGDGALVIDVRLVDDYAMGHIPEAVSLPSEQLLSRIGELPDGAEIIAYCHGPFCVTSAACLQLLREQGRQARHLDGGLTHWHRTGNPLHTGAGSSGRAGVPHRREGNHAHTRKSRGRRGRQHRRLRRGRRPGPGGARGHRVRTQPGRAARPRRRYHASRVAPRRTAGRGYLSPSMRVRGANP